MAEYADKLVVFCTEEEVNQAIKQYEEDTIAHFVVGQKLKGFTSTELQVRRLCWYLNSSNEVKVPYDGIPFSYAGKLVMRCHHGPDKCKKQKVKYKETRLREESAGIRKYGKHRVRKTPLKKVDCPAKISIKKVVKFPEFKLGPGKETEFGKKVASRSVMEALKKHGNAVQKEVRYYVKFAAITDHKNHEMGELAARVEPVDERILTVLHGYALDGVRSCAVLQKLVTTYVEKELFKDKFPPPRTRRRFYPSLSDIRNFLYKNKEEFGKAHSAANSQIMSELGADVPSTSTTVPSADEYIDSGGIVALMNVAVNNHLEQGLTLDSDEVKEFGIQRQTVQESSTNIQAADILVQETIPKQSLTQAHAFTKTVTQGTLTQTSTMSQNQTTRYPVELTQTPAQYRSPAVTQPLQQLQQQQEVSTMMQPQPIMTTLPMQNITTIQQPQQVSTTLPSQVSTTLPSQVSTTLQPQLSTTLHSQQVLPTLQPHPPIQLQQQQLGFSKHMEEIAMQIHPMPPLIHHTAHLQQVTNALDVTTPLPGLPQTFSPRQDLPANKPSRLRLILRMKELSRQLHDYALLVKDTDDLHRLVMCLEGVVGEASKVVTIQPQKPRAKKRKVSQIQNHIVISASVPSAVVEQQTLVREQQNNSLTQVSPFPVSLQHVHLGIQNKTYQSL